jgi:hypothetical protein
MRFLLVDKHVQHDLLIPSFALVATSYYEHVIERAVVCPLNRVAA